MKNKIAFWIGHLAQQVSRIRWSVAVIPLVALTSSCCYGFQFDTGNSDVAVTWDNTVRYSAAWRLKDPDPRLTSPVVNPNNVNTNDGDLNFKKGLISNRFDLFTELDLKYQNAGARFSGAAWHDSSYQGNNDNPGGPLSFPNQRSVAFNQFPQATRDIHGQGGEVLDAFVFGKFSLGDAKATVRAGKHSIVWGESLFFGGNAIAGGQMPVDVVKLVSVPNTTFKEAIRPVPQLSAQIQLNPDLAIGAYYQAKWKPSRLPAVGSYFSNVDVIGDGAENAYFGPALGPQVNDLRAHDSGQGGLQLKFRANETDYGLYYIRFHEKAPQLVFTNFVVIPFVGPIPTAYYRAFHEDITAFGASFSRTFGDVNIAAEASIRHNQDLAVPGAFDTSALGGPQFNNSSNPPYPTGNTAHANVSALWVIGPTPLFNEASYLGELAWNRLLHASKNGALVDSNSTRDAWAMRMIFQPAYRQVFPGIDLEVPIGLGYGFHGSRSSALGPGPMPSDGSGDFSIGLNAIYLDGLKLGVAYTHYFGPTGAALTATNHYSYQQSASDRDFVSFSLRYSF